VPGVARGTLFVTAPGSITVDRARSATALRRADMPVEVRRGLDGIGVLFARSERW
jgi:hypothetical protein